jgi:diketogulonate reductase-like aldo/keto reductase
MATWRQMERLVEKGLVRHIGTSNMTIPKLKLVLRDAPIRPACNEMELHPHFQQPELCAFVQDNGLVPIGFAPIGSPGRPDRDRTDEDTVDVEDPVIVRIARPLGVQPEETVTDKLPLREAARAYKLADKGQTGKVCIVFDE